MHKNIGQQNTTCYRASLVSDLPSPVIPLLIYYQLNGFPRVKNYDDMQALFQHVKNQVIKDHMDIYQKHQADDSSDGHSYKQLTP